MQHPLLLHPIGVIHSPFPAPAGTPIQSSRAAGAPGAVHLLPHLLPGLAGLEEFDRIWLLYWLHLAPEPALTVRPFLDETPHGIFATRAPARPTPIGLSVVRLTSIAGHILHVSGIDVVDGSPLLDIKPYVPEFDASPLSRAGWFDRSSNPASTADDRFHRRT